MEGVDLVAGHGDRIGAEEGGGEGGFGDGEMVGGGHDALGDGGDEGGGTRWSCGGAEDDSGEYREEVSNLLSFEDWSVWDAYIIAHVTRDIHG